VYQKCSNYTLINLLFGLCRSMWISDLLVNFPNPIPKLQHTLLPPKCYESGSAPQLFLLLLSFSLDSQPNHQRAWGCVIIFVSFLGGFLCERVMWFTLKRECMWYNGSSRDFGTKGCCDVWMITFTYFVLSLCPTSERNYVMVWGNICGDYVDEGWIVTLINNQLTPSEEINRVLIPWGP
jgi:hypothetical protein